MFDRIKQGFESIKQRISNRNWEKTIQNFFEKCRWFNIQLTTAFGITTVVHWSVPAFILFLAFFCDPLQAGIACLAFLSVVPHEYGHALAARWYGIKTQGIVLYPIGGMALLEPNKNAKLERWSEFIVAAAGPVVSLGLAIFGLLMMITQPLPQELNLRDLGVWFWLFGVNMLMFVFNMIPAFPMDGGRMLRAIINLFTDHVRSTQYAYYCSVFFCMLIGVYGVFTGSLMLPLTMMIVHVLSRVEYQNVQRQAQLEANQSEEKKSN